LLPLFPSLLTSFHTQSTFKVTVVVPKKGSHRHSDRKLDLSKCKTHEFTLSGDVRVSDLIDMVVDISREMASACLTANMVGLCAVHGIVETGKKKKKVQRLHLHSDHLCRFFTIKRKVDTDSLTINSDAHTIEVGEHITLACSPWMYTYA